MLCCAVSKRVSSGVLTLADCSADLFLLFEYSGDEAASFSESPEPLFQLIAGHISFDT